MTVGELGRRSFVALPGRATGRKHTENHFEQLGIALRVRQQSMSSELKVQLKAMIVRSSRFEAARKAFLGVRTLMTAS